MLPGNSSRISFTSSTVLLFMAIFKHLDMMSKSLCLEGIRKIQNTQTKKIPNLILEKKEYLNWAVNTLVVVV